MVKKLAIRSSVTATLMFLAASTSAHHSALGYDFTKTLSAHATLKEMLWSAPHSTLIFEIKTADGHIQELPLGGSAPGKFMKEGFNPRDFKVGDKLDVTWHPAVDGKLGGIVASITFPDGRVFKDSEFDNLVNGSNTNHFKNDKP
jgi:Family of unknown function (DUF6152)